MLLGYGRLPKDENFIVGTESGLKNLITSCEIAINEKKSILNNQCEISGVMKVDELYFQKNKELILEEGLVEKLGALLFMTMYFGTFIVGIITISKWIF